MFGHLFRPYGRLWTILNNITDVVALSVLWCLCCLPVVTVVPATTALYDSVVRGVRFGGEGVYRRFFRTFRNELWLGVGSTILWGLILFFGAWVLALLQEAGQEDSRAALMAGAYRALIAIPLAAACWSALIPSRFTCSFRELVGLSVRYLPAHLLSSLLIAAFTWLVFWYCRNYPMGLIFAPAVCALGWSFVVEPVFSKYGGGLKAPKTADDDDDEADPTETQ